MVDPALLGSMWTGGLGVVTLVVSRIRCLYQRQDGDCKSIKCGCTEKSIQEDHEEVTLHEVAIGNTTGELLLPKS